VAVRDDLLVTTLPGVFLAGEAAGPADASRCLVEGRLAGQAAARATGHDGASQIEWLAQQVARLPREPPMAFPTHAVGGAGHVCFCEDVREREIRLEMGQSYRAPELVKRRTGVLTGPCQGKFCLANVLRVVGPGFAAPTSRPPAKPVRLGDLAVTEHG
jgi:bacterioferritin-associated ferredoxin